MHHLSVHIHGTPQPLDGEERFDVSRGGEGEAIRSTAIALGATASAAAAPGLVAGGQPSVGAG